MASKTQEEFIAHIRRMVDRGAGDSWMCGICMLADMGCLVYSYEPYISPSFRGRVNVWTIGTVEMQMRSRGYRWNNTIRQWEKITEV